LIALISSLFYLAGLISAAHAVMHTRTAQGAIAWSLSLVTVPFVAVPAYLVFGRNKFEGMAQAFAEHQDEAEALLAEMTDNLGPFAIPVGEEPSWYRAVQSLSNFSLTQGNDVELLIDGESTFESILDGVAQAQDYVLFQFYMIHDDGLGQRVGDVLKERAAAGVRVFVLYDEVGSKGLPAEYVDDLRTAGVEVSSFKPTQGMANRFQLNFRNHRKMVVVDGKKAWVGGHNVGDEYLGLDPEFSPWRDTHVRIEGPAALQLQMTILSDWYWATREIPELNWTPIPALTDDRKVMILPTGPDERLETASLFFVTALSAARQRIWFSSPYFVPDEGVMKALELAALRGVDVRIITTGKADSLPVYLAAFHYMHQLRGLGIRFYAFEPGFLHEKVLLVDDNISTVGTHNFDNRSFRLNFEVMALVVDEEFASQTAGMLERDFDHARLIDPEEWEKRSFFWRLGVQISRLASPVL